uniref:Uncharacterized protein n=1 Tax=Lygus hesperus TaxID=30085 RepID=A0A146KZA8_LYGHE
MRCVANTHLFPSHTHLLLMNSDELHRRMQMIIDAFASVTRCMDKDSGNTTMNNELEKSSVEFLHTFAIKANPLQAVLEVALEVGFGAETASIGEFEMAYKLFT